MRRLRKGQKVIEISRTEIENLIDEWIIGKHAERDRDILRLRLLDGLTYEKIAEKKDMSVRQIKNIVYKRQEVVFKHAGG